ncbi:metallophosphoesterase [bacterium]|nr:metallophosphoesterase [bacterium]
MKSFKNICLSILGTIIISIGSVMADEIRFAQVTDVHYSLNNEYKQKVLTETVKSLNSDPDLKFVVFTGDNIDTAKESVLYEFLKIIQRLNKPYYLVIGDHDVFKSNGLSKERYVEIINEHKLFRNIKGPNYAFKKDGFVFIVVDGAKEVIPGTVGYYKKETLDWLEVQLKKYSKYPVVICQHFPIVAPKEVKSHSTYQAEKYIELIDKHENVIAVLAGHYHTNGEKMLNGVYHITSPSLIVDPPSYKVITIVTTKGFSPMIYTELKRVEIK